MIADVMTVIGCYFSGDAYGVNLLFVTLFFNMFMVGLLVNIVAERLLLKSGSGLMMLAGSQFTYKEIHDPVNWSEINYWNFAINAVLVMMVCLLIERIKKIKNDKRKSGVSN